jgi:MoxR-like ATPase
MTSPDPARNLNDAIARLDDLRAGRVTRHVSDVADHDDGSPSRVCHAWSPAEVDALQVALVTRRPLLIRGEPGSGKTQVARAVAHELGWALHALTVHPRIEPHEVCYRFDAVERLAYAQDPATRGELHSTRFYEPGPLWWALDWATAAQARALREHQPTLSAVQEQVQQPAGHVVLIDEIDKADADLPNSLLEVFGERRLTLPCAPHRLRFPGPQGVPPLIVLTTNEDRELPAPFLRRCVVLSLEVRADDADWLVKERALAHFSADAESDTCPRLAEPVMREAARLLCLERAAFAGAGLTPPGVAEYLDLLTALHQLQGQQHWSDDVLLDRTRILARYLFRKHGGPGVDEHLQQWHQRPTTA